MPLRAYKQGMVMDRSPGRRMRPDPLPFPAYGLQDPRSPKSPRVPRSQEQSQVVPPTLVHGTILTRGPTQPLFCIASPRIPRSQGPRNKARCPPPTFVRGTILPRGPTQPLFCIASPRIPRSKVLGTQSPTNKKRLGMYACAMYGCMDVWIYGCMDVWMYVCM